MTDEETPICFVIAPIGEPDSDVRHQSDSVLRHIIRPVMSQEGYMVIRADEMSDPGSISTQVIQHILADALVVADLSGHNPNVFYELAVRHASRKPVISLIESKERIPFDVADQRAIRYDIRDLDLVEQARSSLISQIHSIKAATRPIATPISQAGNLELLQSSSVPIEQTLADIVIGQNSLGEIQRDLAEQLTTMRATLLAIGDRSPYPRAVSAFYGVGGGRHAHGLGVTPAFVVLLLSSGEVCTYQDVNDTDLQVNLDDDVPFVGIACRNLDIKYPPRSTLAPDVGDPEANAHDILLRFIGADEIPF